MEVCRPLLPKPRAGFKPALPMAANKREIGTGADSWKLALTHYTPKDIGLKTVADSWPYVTGVNRKDVNGSWWLNGSECVTLYSNLILSTIFSNFTVKDSSLNWLEPVHEISNNVVSATSKASDQPEHMPSLNRAFACRLSILWLLSYCLNTIWSF